MTRILNCSIALALFSATAAPTLFAAPCAPVVVDDEDEDPPEEEEDRDELKRLEAWPSPADKKQLKVDVARLRKARTEEMGTQAHIALVAEGGAAAPSLIAALGKEKDKAARARITEVLEKVTAAEHTRLIAMHFEDKSEDVRVWCLRRVAAFPDAGVRGSAKAALKRAEKGKKTSDKELYAAALCCTSTGDLAGLELLAERAESSWKKSGAEIRTALESVRGKQATLYYAPLLESDKRKIKVSGLHLLAGAGDAESATALVAPFLDNTDNTLRVAAINALRGIVDGELPLDKLPVFKAIELANQWKKRV